MTSASRTDGPGGSRNHNSDNPYDAILARYVSRLTEGDDEAFETLGVEGVDPTLDVMEYFDSLKTEVSSLIRPSTYPPNRKVPNICRLSILARLDQIPARVEYSEYV
jgi:hypothetical protein